MGKVVIVIVAIIVCAFLLSFKEERKSLSSGSFPEIQIEGFRLVETRGGVRDWCLSAAKAELLGGEVHLSEIEFTHPSSNLTLTAGRGVMDEGGELQLSNNVSLKSEEVHCSAERALWEKEKQLIKLMGGVSYCFRDVIIKADYVELHGELNNLEKVLGIGNVEIESIADDLKIRGEKLEYFIEKGKSVIKGNVQISKEDVVAKCREALFFEKDRKLVLLGAPQLTQGENRLSGDKIIFYGEKIEAIGSVRAVFFPKEEEEDVLSKSGRFD